MFGEFFIWSLFFWPRRAFINGKSAVVVKNDTHLVHHSPRRSCSPSRFVWTEWPLHHFGCLTETARNEGENKSLGTNYWKEEKANNYGRTQTIDNRRGAGGKRIFKVLEKDWGRENMNMKMRPCLPSMLTQAVFYLWCLSVLIRAPPHCGAPVWQPPTCDSLKWVRRGGWGWGWVGKKGLKEECKWSSRAVGWWRCCD